MQAPELVFCKSTNAITQAKNHTSVNNATIQASKLVLCKDTSALIPGKNLIDVISATSRAKLSVLFGAMCQKSTEKTKTPKIKKSQKTSIT